MLLHGPEAYAPDIDGDTPYVQIVYSLCCRLLYQVHSFWRLQHVVLACRAHANDHDGCGVEGSILYTMPAMSLLQQQAGLEQQCLCIRQVMCYVVSCIMQTGNTWVFLHPGLIFCADFAMHPAVLCRQGFRHATVLLAEAANARPEASLTDFTCTAGLGLRRWW